MNIVEFYEKLSKILEDYRKDTYNVSKAKLRLDELLEKAKESKLDVKISSDILTLDNIVKYDDERSYEEDASYEEDGTSY